MKWNQIMWTSQKSGKLARRSKEKRNGKVQGFKCEIPSITCPVDISSFAVPCHLFIQSYFAQGRKYSNIVEGNVELEFRRDHQVKDLLSSRRLLSFVSSINCGIVKLNLAPTVSTIWPASDRYGRIFLVCHVAPLATFSQNSLQCVSASGLFHK